MTQLIIKKYTLSCTVACALLTPAIAYGMQHHAANAAADCPICLAPLNNGQPTCHLNCHENHRFHRACVDRWFDDYHNTTCPLCRDGYGVIHRIDDPLPEQFVAPHFYGAGLGARLAYIPTWLAYQWRRLTPQPVRDTAALAIDLATIVGCYRGTHIIARAADKWQHNTQDTIQQNVTMQRARYAYLKALGVGSAAWALTNLWPDRFAACTRWGAILLANNQMFLDNQKEDLATAIASNVGVATGLAALPCCKDAVIRVNRLATIPLVKPGYSILERGIRLALSTAATFTIARHLASVSHRYF